MYHRVSKPVETVNVWHFESVWESYGSLGVPLLNVGNGVKALCLFELLLRLAAAANPSSSSSGGEARRRRSTAAAAAARRDAGDWQQQSNRQSAAANQPAIRSNTALYDDNASVESTGSHIVPPESSNSQTNVSPSESKPPKPPNKRKSESSGGRAPSSVWDHFDKVIGEDGKRRAVCKYCYKEYMADSRTHGTSNLRSHTPNCKQFPNNDKDGQQTLSFKPKQNGEEGVEVVATSFSFDACKRALAEMVIIDELPFRFVGGVGFKRFCNVAVPKFTPIPSRHTIAREVTNIFNNERDKLRRIINFQQVEDHKGETLGRKIELCLLEWNIDSIFIVTVDNASSNNLTIQYLRRNTKYWKGTILEHEFLHMRCCVHILNLVVSDGLKEMDDFIANIRLAVRYVRSSPNRQDAFKKCAAYLKLVTTALVCLDVPTRWNSTYLMLEAAEKFEKAFNRLKYEDSNFETYFKDVDGGIRRIPNEEDWKKCRLFVRFLKLFYLATKKFSGSLFVTSNAFYKEMFKIESTINQLIFDNDDVLCTMAMSMKQKFNKYWGDGNKINLLLYVAVALDPIKKIAYLEFCFTNIFHGDKRKVDEMVNKIISCLIRLYNHYATIYSSNESVSRVTEVETMVIDKDDLDSQMESNLIHIWKGASLVEASRN
ncbi:zinc finger BED domain-containing protein RICESLEEPER 2-like [Camellia sinensis]|uniref:zinc finger BED domain-containing protein RICESLEEPER 2-like n=1 Tax=Camellia sinensis TaxID=4442 RepID=UPI001036CC56|nr:zinc finger BED domain-containing protein RICESLEEPER 2-like [Camellia sinensis]